MFRAAARRPPIRPAFRRMQHTATPRPRYVASIDQGTSSTRFMLYDEKGQLRHSSQAEFELITPTPGWVEQDPQVLLSTVHTTIDSTLKKSGVTKDQIAAIGITNQRETTIMWDKETGKPLHNAIVWSDARTASIVDALKTRYKGADYFRARCGLPLSTYFSAMKILWLLENSPSVKKAVEEQRCLFGTVDSWLVWNLCGVHKTDVTNASRTMLMNLSTLQWDKSILKELNIPTLILPGICSSSEQVGVVKTGPLAGVPVSGLIGDQQAALLGQLCTEIGDAKSTYGTGAFILFNTGTKPIHSEHGLLTTLAYQLGPTAEPCYALEGAIAVAGFAVRWLRDNLGIINTPNEINTLAAKVKDNGGVAFVPAFSGLFAPHWRSDARGALLGLTQQSNKCHIARATLEATAFQTVEVLEAMRRDAKIRLKRLLVDGGMSQSDICMQTQSDLLGIPVVRPSDVEATAFGAALAAGLSAGVYKLADLVGKPRPASVFRANISEPERRARMKMWNKAVKRSLGWANDDEKPKAAL